MVLDLPTAYPHLYPTPASWQVLRQALCQGSDSAALNSLTNHCSESKNRKSSEFMATGMQQSIEEQNHDYNNLWFEGETSSTGTNLFSALSPRLQNRQSGRGEGEIYGKSNKAIYITIYNDSQGNLLYGSGNSNRGSINLEGWNGARDGREVQKGGDMCIPMAGSC